MTNGVVENGHHHGNDGDVVVANGHATEEEGGPPLELTSEISIEICETDVTPEEVATQETTPPQTNGDVNGDDKTAVNGVNGDGNDGNFLASPPMSPSMNETTASNNSLEGSLDAGDGKQKKVKKERSFKKTLMKKFNKKSTSQEDSGS